MMAAALPASARSTTAKPCSPAGPGDYRHGGVHDDTAVASRRILVIRDGRARRGDAGAGYRLPQAAVQRLLQRDDAVQLGQLARLIEAVPGSRIHAGRPEQADRVVAPEHPDRDAAA